MLRNVEIKARVADLPGFIERAERISTEPAIVFHQKDTFFDSKRGRLKLREQVDGPHELICYDRPDQEGPKLSSYYIHTTNDPTSLRAVLEQALAVRGEVVKKRIAFKCGQTQIHADEVTGLGSFMELEVVLNEDQSIEDGKRIAEDLMVQLNIPASDLLEGAYMDILGGKSS